MTFLRNLRADLVEKKLWPVAAVLVVALLAVPLLLGRGGGDHQAATVAPPAAGGQPAAPTAQVALDETTSTAEVDRKGRVRDPFAAKAAKAVTSAASKSTGAKAPASSGGASAPSAGGAGPSSGGSSAPSSGGSAGPGEVRTIVKEPSAEDLRKTAERLLKANDGVTVRFSSEDEIGHARDLRPVTPLPSAKYPFVVFVGMASDHKTATFLVASGVRHGGDGACGPSKQVCQVVGLRKGDVATFDYVNSAGRVKHYAMRVLDVHDGRASDSAGTARKRALGLSALRSVARRAASSARG